MWFKVIMKIRTNIKLFTLFSFIFFAASLGSFKGLVLCYGADGHIHTEITFNGVDCGHFPESTSEPTTSHCLTKFNQDFQTHNCISCVDIPLSLDYSLKKFNHSTTQRTASKLRTLFPLLLSAPINALISPATALSNKHLKHIGPTHNFIQNTILLL